MSTVQDFVVNNVPDKHGISLVQHYRQIYKSTGKYSDILDAPDVPERFRELWEFYFTLKKKKELTCVEIDTYCRLIQIRLEPHEVEILMRMDNIVENILEHKRGQNGTSGLSKVNN